MTRVLPLMLTLSLVGCGSSPTAPHSSPVTVTSANDLVFLGADLPLTATVDGEDVTASSEWTVEGAALHLASPGIVHADHSGSAVVWAKYRGIQGRIALRALPNMQGYFTGQYVVDACEETGAVVVGGFCAPPGYTLGSAWPLALSLTQARDVVTGLVTVGTVVSSTVSAPISETGRVDLALTASTSGVSLSEGLHLTSETPGRIDGALILAVQDAEGTGRVTAHLQDVVRR